MGLQIEINDLDPDNGASVKDDESDSDSSTESEDPEVRNSDEPPDSDNKHLPQNVSADQSSNESSGEENNRDERAYNRIKVTWQDQPAGLDYISTPKFAHCPVSSISVKEIIQSDYESSFSDDSYESEYDIPNDEVERMLEDALGNDSTGKKRTATQAGFGKRKPFVEKEKAILIEKGINHFDVLPEGWIQVIHNTGLHIYLHKAGRVCTLARPYFLGPGSEKKHDIPLSAIPCLSYKRALESDEATVIDVKKERPPKQEELRSARIETIRENIEQNNLTPQQVNEYARRRFQFKTVQIQNWTEKCQIPHPEHQLQRPTLPEGTKLISFPVLGNEAEENKVPKREWIMNPNGKSYVCILHEYVQHALKKQPTYKFAEVEDDPVMPYSATVSITDVQYGVGTGTSKKQAKSAAAKATLEMLIPEMRTKIATDKRMGGAAASKARDQDLSLFDEIKIKDPRVAEFCAKTTEPSPHDVLLTCLQRNFGLGDLQISYQGNTLKHQRNEFTMRVGKHSASVVCKNKRDGKQRASQAILQALHPNIKTWGALLRLYGTRSVKSFKEKKMEEQEITLLQSKAAVNQPNFAILDKLRLELSKIANRPNKKKTDPQDNSISSTSDFPNVSASTLNNVDL